MDWLVIVVAVIASVMIGIILYRMNKKAKKENAERKEGS